MSIINQLKSNINSAIFCATPSSWIDVNNPHHWHPLKFSSEMQLCQSKLGSLQVDYSNFQDINNNGKQKIKELKNKVKKRIEELKTKIKTANENEKSDLKSRINELKKAITELEKLERTVTKYNFEIDKEAPQLNYDNNTDTVTVKYDGTLGSLINELKHAFQFETGQLDFIQVANSDSGSTNIPGVLYDLGDELETYKRQYSYDGFLKMRIAWTEKELNDFSNNNIVEILKGTINITGESGNQLGVLEIKSMKFITADIIVKIKDTVSDSSTLYSSLSTKSLDINSSLRQIQKNNTNRSDLGNLSWMGLDNFKKKTPYIEFVKVFIKEKPFIHVK